jgi:hypothetical protein
VVEGIGRRAVELLDLDLDVAPQPDGGAAAPVPASASAPAAASSPAAVPPGFGPAIPLPAPAPALPPAPPAAPRPRRGLRAALAAVLLLGLAGAGVYAFTRPDPDGAADPGDPVVEESPREPVAQELPEAFLGEWQGDLTLDIGIPGGRMTLTLEAGAVGEETGYASTKDVLGISTCVDRMTLTSVSGDEAVFDALLDTEQSTRGTCVTEEFRMVLRLDGEGQVLRYTSVHPDSGAQGVLNRPG